MIRALGLILALLAGAGAASAHPHVMVGAKAEILYDAQGNFTGIRHIWTFDELYSAFATTGLAKGKDGKIETSALDELAKVNVESLNEFEFFSYGKSAGKKLKFAEPVNYKLEDNGKVLTLHFTLPLQQPAPGKTVALEVYDPSYYVAFAFDAGEAVKLNGAPHGCKLTVKRPNDGVAAKARSLGETYAQALTADAGLSSQIENRVLVVCP